jgi:transcriptional regulator with XRE-family HTH domain
MKELNDLRTWLSTQRGRWADIARRSGVSHKTIERIIRNEDYSPTVRTFELLRQQMTAQ